MKNWSPSHFKGSAVSTDFCKTDAKYIHSRSTPAMLSVSRDRSCRGASPRKKEIQAGISGIEIAPPNSEGRSRLQKKMMCSGVGLTKSN